MRGDTVEAGDDRAAALQQLQGFAFVAATAVGTYDQRVTPSPSSPPAASSDPTL